MKQASVKIKNEIVVLNIIEDKNDVKEYAKKFPHNYPIVKPYFQQALEEKLRIIVHADGSWFAETKGLFDILNETITNNKN